MKTKNTTTYMINTSSTEFRTKNSLEAASVMVAQRRNGLRPSAYVIVDVGDSVSVRHVTGGSTSVTGLAKQMVETAK